MTKIHIRNFITILPIFIGVVVFSGVFKYISDSTELKWGFQEQASSSIITIQEFISTNYFESMYNNKHTTTNQFKYYQQSLDKVKKNGDIENLYIFDIQCNKIVDLIKREIKIKNTTEPGNKKDTQHILKPLEELKPQCKLLQQSKLKKPFLTDMNYRILSKLQTTDSSYLSSFIKINNNLILGLDINTNQYDEQLDKTRFNLFIILMIVFILGFFISFIISRVISKEISILVNYNQNETMEVEGRPLKKKHDFFIQEIKDLKTTFNTMNSILKSAFNKTFKSLVNSNKYTRIDYLLKRYGSLKWHKQYQKIHNFEYLIEPTSNTNYNFFNDSIDFKDKSYIFFGCIKKHVLNSKEDNDIEDIQDLAISTSAVHYFIQQMLIKNENINIDILERYLKYYNMQSLHILCMQHTEHQLVEYSLLNNKINIHEINLEKHHSQTLLYNTLTEEIEYKLTSYMKFLSHLELEEIYKELKIIIQDSEGVLVLVRYKK